jgi:hypothetical protein
MRLACSYRRIECGVYNGNQACSSRLKNSAAKIKGRPNLSGRPFVTLTGDFLFKRYKAPTPARLLLNRIFS